MTSFLSKLDKVDISGLGIEIKTKPKNILKLNAMNYMEYISIDPNIRFGRPCIKSTRISVTDVLGWMASGMSMGDILADFPELNSE